MNLRFISEENGRIDWEKIAKKSGDFIWMRAGYGVNEVDLQFRFNAQECENRGVLFGVYWLSYAFTPEMAEKEAAACLETIEEYKDIHLVGIDWGYECIRYAESKGIKFVDDQIEEIIEAFCNQIEEAGYEAVLINADVEEGI